MPIKMCSHHWLLQIFEVPLHKLEIDHFGPFFRVSDRPSSSGHFALQKASRRWILTADARFLAGKIFIFGKITHILCNFLRKTAVKIEHLPKVPFKSNYWWLPLRPEPAVIFRKFRTRSPGKSGKNIFSIVRQFSRDFLWPLQAFLRPKAILSLALLSWPFLCSLLFWTGNCLTRRQFSRPFLK